MITYGIGTLTYPSKDKTSLPGASSVNVNIPVGLSKDEFDKIIIATSQIGEFLQYSNVFNTIVWNFEDLVNTNRAYLQAYTQKDIKNLTSRDISLNINKDLLNFLAASRFYLDYMDRSIKTRFGKQSDLVMKFKSYCSIEYDNSFSYRFIYHLRNHAQHKGIVVGKVKFGQIPGKENKFQTNTYFNAYVEKKALLTDENLKKNMERYRKTT